MMGIFKSKPARNKERLVKAGAVTRRERFKAQAITQPRPFREWEIDNYTAVGPNGECLWISNGFMCFRDYNSPGTKHAFLTGQGILFRWRVWRMICREIRCRSLETMGVKA